MFINLCNQFNGLQHNFITLLVSFKKGFFLEIEEAWLKIFSGAPPPDPRYAQVRLSCTTIYILGVHLPYSAYWPFDMSYEPVFCKPTVWY